MDDIQSTSLALEFGRLALQDYLQLDSNPVFAIHTGIHSTIVFVNKAFEAAELGLQSIVTAHSSITRSGSPFKAPSTSPDAQAFVSWLDDHSQGGLVARYRGFDWTAVTLQQKWRIVRGESVNDVTQDKDTNSRELHAQGNSETEVGVNGHHNDLPMGLQSRARPFLQLSKIIPYSETFSSQHCQLIQDVDWSATSIGPIDQWNPTVLQTVVHALSSPDPCCTFWGPEQTILYNEPYTLLIQNLHPAAMGASAKLDYAHVWPQFEVVTQHIHSTGQAVKQDEYTILIDRAHGPERLSFSGSFTPILDPNGRVCGLLSYVVEITHQVVARRRLTTLLEMGKTPSKQATIQSYWQSLFQSMQTCQVDMPLAVLYSAIDSHTPEGERAEGDHQLEKPSLDRWYLEASMGVPEDHPATITPLGKTEDSGLARLFELTSTLTQPYRIKRGDHVVPDEVFRGCSNLESGTELSEIVICPFSLSSNRNVAFLVLGIHPHYRYNDEYKQFINLLHRQIHENATSVLLLQRDRISLAETVVNAERQQQLLSDQLEQRKREVFESQARFYSFAEQAPVGVYVFGPEGEVKYGNAAFHKLLGIPMDSGNSLAWRDSFHPDDIETADAWWQKLRQGQPQGDYEFRVLRNSLKNGKEEQEVVYLRSSAFPELADDGTMKTITGIVMDLSLQKAHEQAMLNDLASALEAKRAQEYFMDMVSHEMRNPLNAMLQCAEEASQLIDSLRSSAGREDPSMATASAALDAIETITWCGKHQRQIIDDVLTISKLDSNLLTLSPTAVPPTTVIREVVKIFASDFRVSGVQLSMDLTSPGVEKFCMIDSGRVLQILINLVGNAVKFLKERPVRKLHLSVSLSVDRPRSDVIKYVRSNKERHQSSLPASLRDRELIYASFSVQDTGPGMTPTEMDNLFARFKQASPRTHSQYGGSGLGLFISRELAEMHGGEIGLASEVDRGSLFQFFIATYIVDETRVDKSAVHQSQPQSAPPLPPGEVTVLIVEDNVVNQKILDRQLKRFGLKTITANHGAEALEILKHSCWWHDEEREASAISIVLCDLEMPVMDGMACIRRIRGWQRDNMLKAHIPTVAVTGNARAEQVGAAKEAGFDEVVCKPYSVKDLIPLIKRLTGA